jgi:acyl-CoA synthetase (AMP-forming)/AMP-acid ligase II
VAHSASKLVEKEIRELRRMVKEEMQARANRLSNALADAGVVSGDRVAILEVNTDRYVEAYFATAKLDAIFVPLNFRARADELSYMINDATPKVVLAGPRYEDLVKSFSGDVECVDHYISLEGEVDGWLSYESITDAASEDEMMFPEAGDDDISVLRM